MQNPQPPKNNGAARDMPDEPDGPHVLVIEDNRDLAKLFCDLLEIVGCSTDIAGTVSVALDLACKRLPHIVFCDLMLPGEKNGFAFPRELRSKSGFDDVRLIAITGYSNPEDHARAIEAGFERVMTKPVKFADVQTIVNSARKIIEDSAAAGAPSPFPAK